MEKYSLKKAQSEAIEMQKKAKQAKEEKGEVEEPQKEDYDNAEKVIEREREEREVLEEIEQKIKNKEICIHGVVSAMRRILEDGINAESHGIKAMDAIESVFRHGIWSEMKMRFDRYSGRNVLEKTGWGGMDKYTQNNSMYLADNVFKAISKYLNMKQQEGADIKQISYDDMIADDEFLNKFLGKRFHLDIINSPRTKVIFKALKSNADGKLSEMMKSPNVAFGNNLISAWSPEGILDQYKRYGKLNGVDALNIIFKKPSEIHTHPMPTSGLKSEERHNEIGVANKILPKDFIAVMIDADTDVAKIPKEVFDVIPNSLPIISSDLKKVIRMPKKIEKEEM
jgi:hypothetical protein